MQAKLWSISELSVELDIDRRTIAKRLEGLEPDENETDQGGRQHRKYRLARVFAHLSGDGEKELDLDHERARHSKEQADRTAMENEVRRGELLDAKLVGEDLERAFVVFRQRLLSAPTKLATRVNPDNPNAARDLIQDELERALAELSQHFDAAASAQLREDAERAGSDA